MLALADATVRSRDTCLSMAQQIQKCTLEEDEEVVLYAGVRFNRKDGVLGVTNKRVLWQKRGEVEAELSIPIGHIESTQMWRLAPRMRLLTWCIRMSIQRAAGRGQGRGQQERSEGVLEDPGDRPGRGHIWPHVRVHLRRAKMG